MSKGSLHPRVPCGVIYNSKIQNYCVWPSAAEQVQEMPSTHTVGYFLSVLYRDVDGTRDRYVKQD